MLQLFQTGDSRAIEEAIKNDPKLAWSKDESGVSVLILSRFFNAPTITAQIQSLRQGDLTLHEAAAIGDVSNITRMLEVGLPPKVLNSHSGDGFTPLGYACLFGDSPDVIRLLVEAGADVNARCPGGMSQGSSPLGIAAACMESSKSLYMVRNLLEYGADPNLQNDLGATPLHEAVTKNNVEVVQLLLEKGALKDIKQKDGRMPIEIATEKRFHTATELLK
ncbi:hypothetical protein HDU67_009416 [Dinochytrium kinnereticum]|nr:hypothetical protein HDU67_009416 [Dinochytrium kinnereticum]